MLRVGLTGGIGSGKSTVARIFEVLGIPVYYADDAAKRVMNEDLALREKLIEHFGPATFAEGKLDRAHLAATVFSDPAKLSLLNSFVHPATIADAEKWMKLQNSPYAIKEAALIFESDAHLHLDFVIGVHAPYALRLARTMQRDGLNETEVLRRMSNQMDEKTKMKRSDFVVNNDETELLIPQVLKIHETLVLRSSIEI